MTDTHFRKIRSFVRRPGRMTTAQRRARERLLPKLGIEPGPNAVDLERAFGRRAPRVLDIGFGDGEALVSAAARHAELDYLGIEVHEPGVGHLLVLLERAGCANVRIIEGDAMDIMPVMLRDADFAAVNLFFPDPWPKKRHHKRRLVQPAFLDEVVRLLEPDGLFQLVEGLFGNVVVPDALAFRPPTKFERRGRRLGHEVVDLIYRKRV